MAGMSEVADAETTQTVGALISEFCWRVDSGEGARVAELFTDDAIVVTPHLVLEGRKAIGDWFEIRADPTKRLSRHFWTNLRITPTGEGKYTAQAYAMTVVGVPPAPAAGPDVAIGYSTDTVVIESGRALFASRRLDLTFEGRLVAKATA
jgi:ketosteroid isomerase-like protein